MFSELVADQALEKAFVYVNIKHLKKKKNKTELKTLNIFSISMKIAIFHTFNTFGICLRYNLITLSLQTHFRICSELGKMLRKTVRHNVCVGEHRKCICD